MGLNHPVHRVVGVAQQTVGEAALQEIHREELALLHDLVEEDVDALPVPDVLPRALLAQPQEAGGGEGQELLQSVLDVVVAADGEEAAEELVDGRGEAVDVVAVTLQLGLVAAALTPSQLRDGDGDEDHEEAGGEVLLVRLVLGPRGLSEGGQQVGVHLAGVPTGAGQLRHQAGLVRRPGVAVEVLDGGGEERDPLLQLIGERVLQKFSESEDHT